MEYTHFIKRHNCFTQSAQLPYPLVTRHIQNSATESTRTALVTTLTPDTQRPHNGKRPATGAGRNARH